jgi:hypothetical protein
MSVRLESLGLWYDATFSGLPIIRRLVGAVCLLTLLLTSYSRAESYSGEWQVTPCVSYSCDFIFGGALVNIQFCSLTITDTYPSITVLVNGGYPAQLSGTFTSPTSFSVTRQYPGGSQGCTETYTLTGQFLSSNTLSAGFSAAYAGAGCGITTCTNQVFAMDGSRVSEGCCSGATGNIDCDPGNGIDISDLSRLIDFLYVSFEPLCCVESADTDGQPGTDIADLSALIDYLYISFSPTASCP